MAGTSTKDLPTGTGDGRITGLVRKYPGSTLTILAGLLLGFLFYSIREGELLGKLAETDYARGVITFIFAIGTIGVAILLTVAALQSGTDAAEKFTRGKEIFTILVGILGTIIGFYFGQPSTQEISEGAGQATVEVLEIGSPLITNGEVAAGGDITIATKVTGGTPPYEYSLRLEPPVMNGIASVSGDGKIDHTFPLPSTVQAPADLTIILRVTDKNEASARETGSVQITGPGNS